MLIALRFAAATFTTSMTALCAYCLYVMVYVLTVYPEPGNVDTIRQVVIVQLVVGILTFAMLTYRVARR